MSMNLFELAAREKYRFPSIRNDLTVEQLFDLPLVATGRNEGFDLDTVARTINGRLRGVTEESFVATKPHPEQTELTNKLEIVKYVIASIQAENLARREKADKDARRARLRDAIAAKDDQALSQASKDDLLAQLAALDS